MVRSTLVAPVVAAAMEAQRGAQAGGGPAAASAAQLGPLLGAVQQGLQAQAAPFLEHTLSQVRGRRAGLHSSQEHGGWQEAGACCRLGRAGLTAADHPRSAPPSDRSVPACPALRTLHSPPPPPPPSTSWAGRCWLRWRPPWTRGRQVGGRWGLNAGALAERRSAVLQALPAAAVAGVGCRTRLSASLATTPAAPLAM